MISKLIKIKENPRFSPGSFSDTNDKNPVHVCGRDFYLLSLTSSLLPQPKTLRDFWEVIGKRKEVRSEVAFRFGEMHFIIKVIKVEKQEVL